MSERIQLMPMGDDKLFLPAPQAIGSFILAKIQGPTMHLQFSQIANHFASGKAIFSCLDFRRSANLPA
jgi:hypothetical protein